MAFVFIKDSTGDWMRRSFLAQRGAPSIGTNKSGRRTQFLDTLVKVTDTSFGGSMEMNPFPQYTRFCDIRPRALMSEANMLNGIDSGSHGLGHYYSRALDAHAQRIYLRMGVPEYNSLLNFYSGFYNTRAATLARRGRYPGLAYNAGALVGTVIGLPILAISYIGEVFRWVADIPATRYYYSKPTMAIYWGAVSNMLRILAVNMKLIPHVLTDSVSNNLKDKGSLGNPNSLEGSMAILANAYPADFISQSDGGLNIYGIAGKASRVLRLQQARLTEIQQSATSARDLAEKVNDYMLEAEKNTLSMVGGGRLEKSSTMEEAVKRYINEEQGLAKEDDAPTASEGIEGNYTKNDDKTGDVSNWIGVRKEQAVQQYIAEKADGTDFLCLRVNHTGEISESFSNSVGEPEIASTLNSTSASMRSQQFSFAGGNVGDGVLASTLETVFSVANNAVQGFAEKIGISGLIGLAGNAFIDIPNVWENSRSSMATMSYNMELRASSGHPLSIMKDIYIPMACVLAAGLPLSTGNHSYNSPFLVELWDQGRARTRLGMITDISITRGVGNQGWSVDRLPLGVNISFTIAELSNVVHMPLLLGDGFFAEASLFNDWMSTLGALTMHDQDYITARLSLKLNDLTSRFYASLNPAAAVTRLSHTTMGRFLRLFAKEAVRPN